MRYIYVDELNTLGWDVDQDFVPMHQEPENWEEAQSQLLEGQAVYASYLCGEPDCPAHKVVLFDKTGFDLFRQVAQVEYSNGVVYGVGKMPTHPDMTLEEVVEEWDKRYKALFRLEALLKLMDDDSNPFDPRKN